MKFKNFSVQFAAAVLMMFAAGAQAQLTVDTIPTSGLNGPTGLAEDAAGNYYLADSGNNQIVRLDGTYLTLSVLAGTGSPGYNDGPGFSAMFNNPQGIIVTGTNELIVADYGNNLIRSVRLSDGYVSTLAGQTGGGPAVNSTGVNATFRYPSGVTADPNGNVYIADWGNSAVRVMNLNDPALGVTNLSLSGTALHRPWAVAYAGTNQLWVADAGDVSQSDNTIRLFTLSTPTMATLTTYLGGNSIHVAGGFRNYPVGGTNVLFNKPNGLLWVPGAGLFVCDTGNKCIRLATNNSAFGATNYAVTTFAGVPDSSGSADGPAASATFTAPTSLLLNSPQSFILTDSGGGIGNPLRSIQNGVQSYSPEPTPVVGWITIQTDPTTGLAEAVLNNANSDVVPIFNNDPAIAVGDTAGLTIRFTYGPTTNGVADPTQTTNYYSEEAYNAANGSIANVPASIMMGKSLSPDMTIRAVAIAPPSSTRPPSAVATGRFVFQTDKVQITAPGGVDPFHIQLSCDTSNAIIYYTLDGSNPTSSTSNDLVYDPRSPYFAIASSHFVNGAVTLTTFARRSGYYDSILASQVFYLTNAVYDLSVAPDSGYFPMGQILRINCPGTNVFYTMDGTDPTTNSLPVENITNNIGYIPWFNTTNDLRFLRIHAFVPVTNSIVTAAGQSVPAATIGVPPGFSSQMYAGIGSTIVLPVVCNLADNQQVQSYQFRLEITPLNNPNTPVILPLSLSPNNDFVPLVTAAQTGFVTSNTVTAYTSGKTNGLTFVAIGSGSHVLFHGYAVVALLEVQLPYLANVGDTYALNVLYPSATADAYNMPVPLTAMSPMTIVVTNLPYTVGDSASPNGYWYNAGTFGNDNLDNSDVNQAFYAASGLRVPYAFSDVFNAMDAFPPDTLRSVGGDGQLRFLDWMTILQRSLRLDPSDWAREWSAGGNLIDFTTNLIVSHGQEAPETKTTSTTSQPWSWYRQVLLGANSVGQASPNTTVSVPIYVQLADGSSLSGLQFRAVVTPQNGAPALTAAPQLGTAAGVNSPLLTQSFKSGETAFGWSLGSFNYLSRSSNFLGWITFPVPTNAVTGQTYQVSLLNADGAPNLTNQYDFEARSATVAVNAAAPPATICSDEWKIHFFGSTTNPAAADNADPDGDGIPNWMEFLAGTDPTDPQSNLQLGCNGFTTSKGKTQMQLNWLTAPGHAYTVQWTTNLAGGAWQTLTAVSGTGFATNCADSNPSTATRYYRLYVTP